MTLAELYAALEKLEGGKDLVAGFKGEISRINEVAKADRLKFEKQITDLTTARDELKGKVDEFEAHAESFSKLIAGQISVQQDGSYGWTKDDGTIGTIEECATAFLADKPYAVKTAQNGGSGAGAGNANDGNSQLAEMYKIAGIKPPSEA